MKKREEAYILYDEYHFTSYGHTEEGAIQFEQEYSNYFNTL